MKINVKETVPITFSSVNDTLLGIKKLGDVSFRAARTLEFFEQIKPVSPSVEEKLLSDLNKLNISRLRDIHYLKLIDILPSNPKDVKLALQGFSVTLKNEDAKKISDIFSSVDK